MTQPDDMQLLALGRDVERNARRLGDVETLVRQLCAEVAGLARRLGAAEAEEESRAVRALLASDDAEQAAADLADLVNWLASVYLQYPGSELRSCWLWHPDVVEELWWLRCAHADAYHPENGTWQRVGDWHDRQRPGVARRISKAIGSCELSLHVPGARRHQPSASVPLVDAAPPIAAWIVGGQAASPPVPTAAQLAEAERYDAELHRSHR
ncbi:hypothetical protein [Pseudonocardia sp.]|uniref:hypothetical protein n=1 Tax=Pseudonocardia sp. TaxID=60912 RepID=UPI003D133E22